MIADCRMPSLIQKIDLTIINAKQLKVVGAHFKSDFRVC